MKQYATCPVCSRTVELEFAAERPAISPLVIEIHDKSPWRVCMGSRKTIQEARAAAERGAA